MRHRADAELEQEARIAEQLVLEEDLVDDLLRASDEQCAAPGAFASWLRAGDVKASPVNIITSEARKITRDLLSLAMDPEIRIRTGSTAPRPA